MNAQGNYNVNVYSNRYENMATKYTPLEVQSTTNHSSDLSRQRMEDEMWLEDHIRGIQQRAADGKTIISDEVGIANATNLANKSLYTIRTRTIKRKNGRTEMSCLGIKRGESWQPCNKPIIFLQQMYESAKTEAEKVMILELMDYGEMLLDTGTELFVIK